MVSWRNQVFENNLIRLLFVLLFFSSASVAQVVLRDTTITWQHHSFELNDDHSTKSFSTSDKDIQEVVFSGAKVVENEGAQKEG